jgi:hypothetical protein
MRCLQLLRVVLTVRLIPGLLAAREHRPILAHERGENSAGQVDAVLNLTVKLNFAESRAENCRTLCGPNSQNQTRSDQQRRAELRPIGSIFKPAPIEPCHVCEYRRTKGEIFHNWHPVAEGSLVSTRMGLVVALTAPSSVPLSYRHPSSYRVKVQAQSQSTLEAGSSTLQTELLPASRSSYFVLSSRISEELLGKD